MEGLTIEIQSQGVQAALEQMRTDLGDRAAARILRQALRHACSEIRRRVRSHDVSGSMRRAAAATLGYKVEVRRGVLAKAKLGFGLRRRGGSRWREQHKLGLRSGVGLSERNIHWAVLGTGPRKTRRGQDRGRMPAYFQGFLGNTVGRIRQLLYEAALAEIQKQIQKIQRK